MRNPALDEFPGVRIQREDIAGPSRDFKEIEWKEVEEEIAAGQAVARTLKKV